MGFLSDIVKFELSKRSTSEQDLVKSFLHIFSISWFREYTKYGTVVSAYLLKPDKAFADTGYTEEILLSYSPFSTVEPRFLRVCEEIFTDPDVNGRVDPYAVFLVSDAANVADQIYAIATGLSSIRMPVVFSSSELVAQRNNPWFVRQRFLEKVASRDLFDVRLPIHDELGFFGRKDELSTIIDSTRRSENVGLFGLRKVGKTSVLFRAQETCRIQDIATVVYIDCKRPDIWSYSWEQLLEFIITRLDETSARTTKNAKPSMAAEFHACISNSKRRLLLIFDHGCPE